MSEKSHAGKVGLFVFIGIVLIGALMLNFSRGVGLFRPKYELSMRVRSVAGLKERSSVNLSGVQIGNVKSVKLDQKTKTVIVRLTILKEFPLHNDSKFVIEQIGEITVVSVCPNHGARFYLRKFRADPQLAPCAADASAQHVTDPQFLPDFL